MKKTLLFFAAILIWSGPSLAEVQYTASSLRDPFSEQTAPVDQGGGPLVDEGRLRELGVQGIVASAKNPRVIINGQIYQVGSEVMPGARITRIEKEGIYVTSENQKEILLTRTAKPTRGQTDEIPLQ